MMGENATVVENYLAQVRLRRHKFICLNDDIKTHHPDPRLFQVIKEYFEGFYPNPSPFELPEVCHFCFVCLMTAYSVLV
jgi:hypothetical protein